VIAASVAPPHWAILILGGLALIGGSALAVLIGAACFACEVDERTNRELSDNPTQPTE